MQAHYHNFPEKLIKAVRLQADPMSSETEWPAVLENERIRGETENSTPEGFHSANWRRESGYVMDKDRQAVGRRPAPGIGSLVTTLWLVAGAMAPSQEPNADLGKPLPFDGNISAVKGQTVTIELVSDAKTRAAVVEFLIRDFPLNGEFGPMVSREEDRTKATITYTPFADTAATSDSFTYAVRYPGGQWSRKGKVNIKLEASEPKIHATAEADFGQVMLGQSEDREIFLSNSGNASYRNQITLSAPWSLVEPANGLLNLPVGAQQVVKVRYTPQIEGPATFQLAFYRNQGATTQLRAAAYAPFSIGTPEIALTWEEKSRTRLGRVSITGLAPKLLAAAVKTDQRLQVGAGGALFLKPNEVAEVQIYLPPQDVLPYEGSLEIAVGDFKLPVKVSATVAPAHLVLENLPGGERVIDFGQIKAGGFAQSSFQLRNAGGTTAKATLSAETPFTILAAGGRATLSPQEAEAFAVRVVAPPKIVGNYESILKIEADSGQSIPITLRAFFLPEQTDPNAVGAPGSIAATFAADMPPSPPGTVPPADRPPTTPGATRTATQEEIDRAIAEMDALRSPLGFITMPTVVRALNPSVPTVAGDKLTLIEDGTNHLTIGWTPPAVDADTYELEMRVMRTNADATQLESVWVPYHDVSIQKDEAGQFRADIRGLGPNRTYEFRLFTLGQGQSASNPLPFVAKTRMPMDWTWIYVGFAALLLGGIGYAGWRLFQARSQRGLIGFPRGDLPFGLRE